MRRFGYAGPRPQFKVLVSDRHGHLALRSVAPLRMALPRLDAHSTGLQGLRERGLVAGVEGPLRGLGFEGLLDPHGSAAMPSTSSTSGLDAPLLRG